MAKNFSLSTGKTTVTVPASTAAGTRYLIVLMGDSGNTSKEFTIKAAGSCTSDAKKQTDEDADLSPFQDNFAKSIEDAVELPSA